MRLEARHSRAGITATHHMKSVPIHYTLYRRAETACVSTLGKMLRLLKMKEAVQSAIGGFIRLGMPRVYPEIIRILPHDQQARTQGLMYRDGLLYESAGSTKSSTLRCIDPSDASIQKSITIDGDHAEGIATIGNRLFQIFWRSGIARIYQLPDLVQIGEVHYEGQGWGLASCPNSMVMSNGTSRLRFRDVAFRVTKEMRVRSRGIPLRLINDLEFVNGMIYANLLGSTDLWVIEADSGKATGIVDCSALAKQVAPLAKDSVFNGIAYNSDHDTFFVTGKNWKYLFEIRIPDVAVVRTCSGAAGSQLESTR